MMKKYSHLVYIVVGVCALLWGIFVFRVHFVEKPQWFEVQPTHVSQSVSYPSTYRPSSNVSLPAPVMPHRSVSTGIVRVPQITMHSTSSGVSSVSSSAMRIYTTSSHGVTTVGSGGSGASCYTTTSGRKGARGINYSQAAVIPVQGLLTSASVIRGGVTADETYARMNRSAAPRKNPSLPPGACDHCDWVYDPISGQWICSECGANVLDGCDCSTDPTGPGYCWCPIGDGWQVWLFMAVLGVAYALWKSRKHQGRYGDVRNGREMVAFLD